MIEALRSLHLKPVLSDVADRALLLQHFGAEFSDVRVLVTVLARLFLEFCPLVNAGIQPDDRFCFRVSSEMTLGTLELQVLAVNGIARALVMIEPMNLLPVGFIVAGHTAIQRREAGHLMRSKTVFVFVARQTCRFEAEPFPILMVFLRDDTWCLLVALGAFDLCVFAAQGITCDGMVKFRDLPFCL